MSRDDVVAHIRRGRDDAAAELAELEKITPDADAHPYDGYVVEYGLEANRAFLRWADRVLADLDPEASERGTAAEPAR